MELMAYQVAGAQFLASRKRALLADAMGVGKTAQAIEASRILRARRVVTICPAIARINWQREWNRWSGEASLHVYSYDQVATQQKVRDEIAVIKPDILILDEAHYLKTKSAKRTKAIYGAFCRNTGVAQHASHIWLLTGTPCPNNAGELYTHFSALWPELIQQGGKAMNYIQFIERYCVLAPSQYGAKIVGNKNAPELRGLLQKVILRRRVEDVLPELPPMIWNDMAVEAQEVVSELAALEQEPAVVALKQRLEKTESDLEAFEVQVASLRRVTGTAKAGAAARLIADELSAGAYDKIVVFTQHKDAMKRLSEELGHYGVVSISGETPTQKRQEAIDKFQSHPETRVFIGQIQACATAITLHAANHVLFVEASWTPSDNAQAAKRCHRIGQHKPVFVRVLGLANSIDEAVAKALARKSKAISELMEERQSAANP